MSVEENNQERLLPADWFHLYPDSIFREYNHSSWPWSSVSMEEFVDLLIVRERYIDYYTANVTQKLMWTFCAFGIIGGCLIVVTIAKMPKSARTNFFKITNIIGVLDVAFLIDAVIRKQLMVVDGRSMALNVVMFITSATVFCFSLISDLLTLMLSVERYVALTFPAYYKRVDRTTENRLWNAAIVLSTVISLCRSRYAFGNSLYNIYSITETTFFLYLTYFSDVIIPVVTSAVMILMVLGILRALIRRAYGKLTANNQFVQKRISDCMKSMSLLAVLVLMFLLNQAGYIYYEVEYTSMQNAHLSFNSSLVDVRDFLQKVINLELATNASSLTEVASKTFTFYTYIIFNSNFRNYFFAVIKFRRFIDTTTGPKSALPVTTIRADALKNASQMAMVDS